MINKKVFSVKELNYYLKSLLESDGCLKNLWVKGEISNYKAHSSGHAYFVLKDASASVRCVMFRSRAMRLVFRPENGMQVILRGYLSVFERDGQYQLYAEEMLPAGKGALHLAFEQLKTKLDREGFFDEARKRDIPLLPKKIGVVTSSDGAAWQDIQKVIFKRFPEASLVLVPSSVQGEKAPGEIARGIGLLNKEAGVEVIIVGRGGGSLEELWAFNTETVARAIYSSGVPVISAVGHQTDFTIADFVADRRAATPSAAAEMAVPVYSDLEKMLQVYGGRLIKSAAGKLAMAGQQLAYLRNTAVLIRPEKLLQERMQKLDMSRNALERFSLDAVKECGNRMGVLTEKLNMLNPLNTLSRGYAVCRSEKDNRVITSSNQVEEGERVEVLLALGKIFCRVTNRVEGGDR